MATHVTSRTQWWTAFVAGMASYIDAAAITTSGIALVMMKDELGLDAAGIGVLSSVLTFAIAVGALVGGRLGDRVGRRLVFLSTMATILIGCAVIIFSPGFTSLLIGMVLLGLGSGADLPVSLATIAEIARANNRGALLGFSHLLWKLGSMATLGLGALLGSMGHLGAQVMFGHIGVVTAIVLVLRLSVPESEKWTATRQLVAENDAASEELTGKQKLQALLRPPFVTYFVTLLVFYTLMNLGMNSVGQFGAYMFVEVAGGTVQTFSTIKLVTMFVGALLVLWFMRAVSGPFRMRWFAFGAITAALGLALPAVLGPTVPTLTAMLLLWLVGTVFAGEAIMKIWTQESFPTMLRATTQGAVVAVARAATAGLALVTPLLLESGPRGFFLGLLGCVVVACGLAYAVFSRQKVAEIDLEDEEVAEAEAGTGAADRADASAEAREARAR